MKTAAALLAAAGVWVLLDRVAGRNGGALDAVQVGANLAVSMIEGNSVVDMKLSDAGLQAIATREGFSANRYRDADGYSIGYGHFIQFGESFSEPISQGEAYQLLLSDTGIAQSTVRAYVKVNLTQPQFDALVSLVYNVGAGSFKKSRLLTKLNAGDYTGAAAEMKQGWNTSNGVYMAALDVRREAEYQQFWALG